MNFVSFFLYSVYIQQFEQLSPVLDGHYLCVTFQAMSALLCCGPCFDPHYLSEEGIIYPWLDLVNKKKLFSFFKKINEFLFL